MPVINNTRKGFLSAAVTGNKTLTAADSGIVQDVQSDAVISLPASTAGLTFTIHVGQSATSGNQPTVTIDPNASDGVTGNGYTATVNKDLISDKTTNKYGDLITLRGTGTTGVTGWIVESVIGTWARQA
ncbi:hypothetical protein [Naasia lichenicola]|uniref:DUF2190 family protein n=1 Tax=Naasia lichenicola TaxID=2565933 RepID=A0A4V3WT51_9MICO|nr:hypothetical protein [Naasia lichenicola]THG30677.1 hypothetical protein E6C64_08535 [Naasia lichenicola]THG31914.1 hypothetical protein E6C64_07680 [Naasia lichenicola]